MDHVAPPPLRTRIARRLLTIVAVGLAVAATLPAAPAHAQTATDPATAAAAADAAVADLRAEADALAGRYFEALGHVAEIQQKADDIEAKLPALRAETARLRDLTRDRAVAAYKRAGRDLGVVVGANDPLAAARRADWLNRLNQRDGVTVANLEDATAKLDAQRTALRAARDDAEHALTDAKAQGDQINTVLANAEQQRQAALAAALAPPAPSEPTPSGGDTGPSVTPTTRPTTTTTTEPPPKSTPPPAPPTYVPTAGVHAQHDNAFLVCTRTRESGGNYAAYNPAGPYLGAYQFLQATWNSAANHAGRTELINVPPSTASQYDQDDMAWSLYVWQGSRPWGGLCDDAT
jgi:peptidoglycan hydrolase CwlO-like protein